MISDDRTVSDELLGAAIRDVTAALNDALSAAYEAGLLVYLDQHGYQTLGRRAPRVVITTTVSRPL